MVNVANFLRIAFQLLIDSKMKPVPAIVDEWIASNKSTSPFRAQIVALFERAIEHTLIPEQSWFGSPASKSSLSILMGRNYLVGIYQTDVLEILLCSQDIDKVPYPTKALRHSKKDGAYKLHWLKATISDISDILSMPIIWESYRRGTYEASTIPGMCVEMKRWQKGKQTILSLMQIDGSQDQSQLTDGQINRDAFDISPEKAQLRDARLRNEISISSNILLVFLAPGGVAKSARSDATNQFCALPQTKNPAHKDGTY
jgi:hypothetical protein